MASRNHKVEIVVGVKDMASRALQSIQKTTSNMGRGIGNITKNWGNVNRVLDTTIRKMDKLAGSMYNFNMYTADIQRNLQNAGLIGLGVAGAVGLSGMNSALDFDYKSRTMQSRMGVGETARKDIEKFVLEDLNLRVGFNPNDLMDMGVVLGQGGISSSTDMKALMNTTSYFSEAVDAVPEQAAEMIISAAKGFNISMENSKDITDKLSVALNGSLLHVEELPHAIGELSGRAAMYGQTFDSSLVALMVARDQGMSAAQGAQDFLHGLRSVSNIGNEMVLYPKRRSYYEALGIDDSFFDMDKRQLKEYPEIIKSLEKTMINNGFINPKYKDKVGDLKEYRSFVKENGGTAPEDFWDKKEAMPLIARVFGAAGMAPMMMGLQAKYEDVDPETGEKTGKVLYGSAAVEKMYGNVKNSDGAVDKTHDIIAESGKYQLEILSGAWQATQIKFLDGLVPVIKTGAEQMTNFLSGKKVSREAFKDSFKESADGFRKEGNTTTGNIVEGAGNAILGAIDIGSIMPPVFKQIGKAINENFIQSDWGGSLLTFPMHLIENGIGFINDLLKANKTFNEAVSKLPENLQDPAKLVEGLAKGGLILLVSGAVIKAIELSLRTASAALKTGKAAINAGDFLLELLGLKKGKSDKGKGGIFGKGTATINANIVNVYGKSIGAGGVGGGKGGKGGGAGGAAGKLGKGGLFGSLFNPATIIAGTVGSYITGAGIGWSKWKSEATNRDDSQFKALLGVVSKKKDMDALSAQISSNHAKTADKKDIEALGGWLRDSEKRVGAYVSENSVLGGKGVQGIMDAIAANREQGGGMNKFDGVISALQGGAQQLVDSSIAAQGNIASSLEGGVGRLSTTAATAAAAHTGMVNSSIVSGFATANSRLQNIRLANTTNVNVAPPTVSVTGNLAPHLQISARGSTTFSSTNSNPSGAGRFAQDRMAAIMKRRIGW